MRRAANIAGRALLATGLLVPTVTFVAAATTSRAAAALGNATVSTCDTPSLNAALVTAGSSGTVTFACDGQVPVDHLLTISAGTSLTLDATGHSVTLGAFHNPDGTSPHRFAMVDGGDLTLKHLTVIGYQLGQQTSRAADGVSGTAGTAGAQGDGATSPFVFSENVNGEQGVAGGGGTGGTSGASGESADGAALYVASGNVTLDGVTMSNNSAEGVNAGNGGNGGSSGAGGPGGNGCCQANHGGDGGRGGDGASAGSGGNGGSAHGGAVYNAGTLTIINSTFNDNQAFGGAGGEGGIGGSGGPGGSGGSGTSFVGGSGGAGGSGADAAPAGRGGDAEGGAIWSTGTLSITGTTFLHNLVLAGGRGQGAAGGTGGNGGDGWPNPQQFVNSGVPAGPGNGGNGGAAGAPATTGAGGNAQGGAVYDAGTGVFGSDTFTNNSAETGGPGARVLTSGPPGGSAFTATFHSLGFSPGTPGGVCGTGYFGAHSGSAGAPSAGLNGVKGADAAGGAIATNAAVDTTNAFSGQLAIAEAGQLGSFGGLDQDRFLIPFTSGVPLVLACTTPPRAPSGSDGADGVATGANVSKPLVTANPQIEVLPTGTPGQFQFIATVVSDSDGNPLNLSWDFGDTGTAIGSAPVHQYVKPGQFTVKLTSVPPGGSSSVISTLVQVAPPELSASILVGAAVPTGCAATPTPTGATPAPNPQPGGKVVAVLAFHADANGVGDLSGLSFTGDPLSIAPPGRMTVESGADPAIDPPLTLSPGDEVSFVFCLDAVNVGLATLATTVNGHDASGTAIPTTTAQKLVTIGDHLQVAVTTDPEPIRVPDDTSGKPIPQPFIATVTVTNPFSQPLTHVFLTRPLLVQKVGSTKTVNIDQQGDVSAGEIDLGPVAAGGNIVTTIPFMAETDGTVDLTAQARAPNPNAPAETISGEGDTLVHVNPTALLTIDLQPPTTGDGCTTEGGGTIANCVTGGQPWDIFGVVTNITNATSVQLDPLAPTANGNASGGNPVDLTTSGPPDPGNPNPPTNPGGISFGNPCGLPAPASGPVSFPGTYPLPFAPGLAPLDTTSFGAQVYTSPVGPNSSSITYTPKGVVTLPDGSTRPLTADDVLIDPSNATSTVVVDLRNAPLAPATFQSWVANFSVGLGEGICQWTVGQLTTVPTLLHGLGNILEQTPVDLLQTFDYLVEWYNALTPQQRDGWLSAAAASIAGQTKESFDSAKAKVDAATQAFFQPLGNAMANGDTNALANIAGQTVGNIYIDAPLWFIHPNEAGNVVRLSDEAQQQAEHAAIPKAPAQFQAGDDLLNGAPLNARSPLNYAYGMNDGQIAEIRQLAADEDLLIGVRSRSQESIFWESQGAVLKPENLKAKTVSDLDAQFLGYSPNDVGIMAFREPISQAKLEANLVGADPTVAAAARARWAKQVSDFSKLQKQYAGFEKNGIPVGFDYQANGIPSEVFPTNIVRRGFSLEKLPDPSGEGKNYFRVLMADDSNVLQPVTGDIDVVSITAADGHILSPDERLAIYNTLEDMIGMQHGETLSWLPGGELSSKAKTDLLNAHTPGPGNEPLAVFGPDGGARATFINPNLTFFDQATGLGRVWYIGGYKTPFWPHFSSLFDPQFKAFEASVTSGFFTFISPAGFSQQLNQKPNGNSLLAPQSLRSSQMHAAATPTAFEGSSALVGTCTWAFSTDPVAQVVQPDPNGPGLVQLTSASGIEPVDLSSCVGNAAESPPIVGGVLRILPETVFDIGAPAGASTLGLDDVTAVAPFLDPAMTPWFAVGQRIVIDPAAPDEEVATITATAPLTLAAPLRFDHGAGTMVAVAPAGFVDPTTVAPPPPTTTSDSTSSLGAVLARTGFDIVKWMAVGLVLLATGLALLVTARSDGGWARPGG